MRLSKVVAPLCAAAVAASAVLLGSPQALADPLSDAQAQLDQLEAERSGIEQQYIESQERLEAAQAQQVQLASDITDQQAKIDAMKPAIVWIVTTERQGGGVNLTARFLLNDSPDTFLSQMATAASVETLINEQLESYVSEQARLSDLNISLATTITTIQAEAATQQELLAEAQAKEAAAQKVVDRLTAQQQAALAARQAAAAAAAGGNQGGSGASPASGATAHGSASAAAIGAMNWALQQNGKKYRMGGTGPDYFDCSGLVMMAYRSVGIALPRTASAQARVGVPVARGDLQPGDLVFFYTPIRHVSIYIGNNQIIHAANTRSGVLIATIWGAYNSARRVA